MKKFTSFFRKYYMLFVLLMVFAWWGSVFISSNFELHKTKNLYTTSLQPVGELLPTGENVFYQSEVTIETDITEPGEKLGPPPDPFIYCVLCGEKIQPISSICPHCGAIQPSVDTDSDRMPNYWEIQYGFDPENPADAEMDTDQDKYTNLEEFFGDSDPLDAESTPVIDKLDIKLVSIYRRPIDILFRGYVEKNDHTFDLTVNWEVRKGGKTYFVRVGDTVRGYEIIEFKKIIKTDLDKRRNIEIERDLSYILLRTNLGETVKLQINVIYLMKELFARIRIGGIDGTSEEVVHAGSEFKAYIDDVRESFTVSRIFDNRIFFKDKKDKEYGLLFEK